MQTSHDWKSQNGLTASMKRAIARRRKAAGLTQEQCAARAGMGQSSDWSNLEREHGTATISPQRWAIVANVLGVDGDDLLLETTITEPRS